MTGGYSLRLGGRLNCSRFAFGSVILPVLLTSSGFIATELHAVVAVPTGIYTDAQWEWKSSAQRYEVEAAAFIYEEEQWELPVEGGKWGKYFDGPVEKIYTTGKYYAYGDLTQVEMSNVSNQYWNTRFSVAGDYLGLSGEGPNEDRSTEGLKGSYYIYFGDVDANNHYAFEVKDASGLSTSFDDSSTKAYSATSSPFGSAIEVTNEGQKVFSQDSSLEQYLTARTLSDPSNNVYDIDVRFDYAGSGIDLGLIDYFFVGVAVSNPSSPDLIFINDNTPDDDFENTSYEYDTLRIENPQNPRSNPNYVIGTADGDFVPEPSSYALLLGLVGFGFTLQRRRV